MAVVLGASLDAIGGSSMVREEDVTVSRARCRGERGEQGSGRGGGLAKGAINGGALTPRRLRTR